MTAVATDRAVDRSLARLVWAPTVEGRRLDGAWWPRTRDAVAELSVLIPVVSEHIAGRVTRVSLNIDAWDSDQPRRLRIGDMLVRLGWFRTLDAATVTLGRGISDRIRLVVVPPDLDPHSGSELMRRLAADTRWPDTAAAALT